jgi:hypothetical protein
MDEVMKEVSELAHNAGRWRVAIVGTEKGRERRVGDESRHATAQGFSMDENVGIKKEDQRGNGDLGPEIAGGGGAERPFVPGHGCTHRSSERAGAVRRAIVDDDELEICPG